MVFKCSNVVVRGNETARNVGEGGGIDQMIKERMGGVVDVFHRDI